jgi:hypothetical protein
MAHLFIGGADNPPPAEYIELVLCRDVYHCPPAQLPPLPVCLRALALIGVENKVRQMQHG